MSADASRDERLQAVLLAHLQAVDAGQAPDRDELLRRHPDVADELRAYFADQEQIDKVVDPLRHVAPNAEAETLPLDEPTSVRPSQGKVRDFGDYELLEEIARGGMGVVYKARQVSLNRAVALKMILAGQLATPIDVVRFRNEAENAAQLEHPNIVPIYEIGEHEGQHYFSMKLIEGGSLAAASRTSAGALGPAARLLIPGTQKDIAQIIAAVARAVHYGHQRGILHRDLKPGNILIDADHQPYVTDFGLSRRLTAQHSLSPSGAAVGTPSYMAPEQAQGKKGLSVAADVYSLGAILYELLTGRPPFQAATPLDTMLLVVEKEPDHPKAINPQADRDLCAIALKCLQKKPEDRYESAAALADDLDHWLRGEPTKARPPSLVGLAWRWLKRNAAAALGIIVLGTITGLSLVLFVFTIAGVGDPKTFLYPLEMNWFNPVHLLRLPHEPGIRWFLLAGATALLVGMGWLIRLIARPRVTKDALAAGASVGLVATLVAFSSLATTESYGRLPLTYGPHPLINANTVTEALYERKHGGQLLQEGLEYLAQYLPPGHETVDAPGNQEKLAELGQRAFSTNCFCVGILGRWLDLFLFLVLFLGVTLGSTWAANYVARSSRGVMSRVLCYLELYLPTAAWLGWCVPILVISLSKSSIYHSAWRTLLLSPLIFGGALVLLAHLGVIRRWHPITRTALYCALLCLKFVLANKLEGL